MFSFEGLVYYVICFLGLIKLYNTVTKGFYNGNERLEGKTVVITGANAGIGTECAKDFARRGARIIMVCRDMKKGERVKKSIIAWTGNRNLVIKHIDFASLESVRRCANEILNEEPRIDILLNNAGAIGLGLNVFTRDGLELNMQINYFAPFLFTNILLGRIKESAPARIVNVASMALNWGIVDLDDLRQTKMKRDIPIYANAKLATKNFTITLADRLKGTGVTANYLHPGVVATDIIRTRPSLFQLIWNTCAWGLFKDSWEGAQTSIFACVSPSVENVTGKYFVDCKELTPFQEFTDCAQADRLWELSEKAVKLKDCEQHY